MDLEHIDTINKGLDLFSFYYIIEELRAKTCLVQNHSFEKNGIECSRYLFQTIQHVY